MRNFIHIKNPSTWFRLSINAIKTLRHVFLLLVIIICCYLFHLILKLRNMSWTRVLMVEHFVDLDWVETWGSASWFGKFTIFAVIKWTLKCLIFLSKDRWTIASDFSAHTYNIINIEHFKDHYKMLKILQITSFPCQIDPADCSSPPICVTFYFSHSRKKSISDCKVG